MEERKTKQKNALNKISKKLGKFFSAEELHNKCETEGQNIGIATIYRFLKKEAENENLNVFECEGKKIYSRSENEHSHFTCTNCHKKVHLKTPMKIFKELKKQANFTLEAFQIEIAGLCENCISKQAQ